MKSIDIEKKRYDTYALEIQKNQIKNKVDNNLGIKSVKSFLREPYICYHTALKTLINKDLKVLELASGTGIHTKTLLDSGALIVASDISKESLKVLSKRFPNAKNLKTLECDMADPPLGNNCYDLISCAGSMSYCDNDILLNNVYRLLAPGGYFVAVDSLNHNPVYKFNRFIHFLKGNRTRDTLRRMPTMQLLKKYEKLFEEASISYFGAYSWIGQLIHPFLPDKFTIKVLELLDLYFKFDRMAFKFVLVAKK